MLTLWPYPDCCVLAVVDTSNLNERLRCALPLQRTLTNDLRRSNVIIQCHYTCHYISAPSLCVYIDSSASSMSVLQNPLCYIFLPINWPSIRARGSANIHLHIINLRRIVLQNGTSTYFTVDRNT